jgi:hypothetical protein
MPITASQRRSPALDLPWWRGETVIDLAEVPQHMPERGGSRVSMASVRRWHRFGVQGVRLRVFATGARSVATTVEELGRFQRALTTIRGLDS